MTIRELDQLIEEAGSLQQIAQAYSEIANQKIKRIRSQVEVNRLFFKDMSRVYALVKVLAAAKKITVPKRKKMLCIILTSNYRFYGQINSTLIDYFIQTTQKIETEGVETDRIMLGKAAIEYFKKANIFRNYEEILLKSDTPDPLELTSLVNIIKDYNQVLIFYSRLKSLLVQEPSFTDITATTEKISLDKQSLRSYDLKQSLRFGDLRKEVTHFIFEPELDKILAFFDSQILTLLLEETFLESEVSRTASRFISMDQAETESIKVLKDYERLRSYAQRNMRNNQLLESIASILAVRKA